MQKAESKRQKAEGRRQKSLAQAFCLLPSAFCLFVLFACAAPAPPPPVPAPAAPPAPPRFTTSGAAKRVVLVSFDGLGADEERRFGAPAFDRLAAHATRVIPVTPTATSSIHAAILTGAGPDQTGIV